MKAEGGTQEE